MTLLKFLYPERDRQAEKVMLPSERRCIAHLVYAAALATRPGCGEVLPIQSFLSGSERNRLLPKQLVRSYHSAELDMRSEAL
jgi:hypothetical protein